MFNLIKKFKGRIPKGNKKMSYNKEYYDGKKQKLFERLAKQKDSTIIAMMNVIDEFRRYAADIQADFAELNEKEKMSIEEEKKEEPKENANLEEKKDVPKS